MPVGENHLASIHDAAHSQVYTAMALELFNASLKLTEERATYQAGADHAD
jgi:hypothetical protein